MTKLRVLSLFAGIGGFDLGLERTGGFETVAFCEIDKKAQAVLRKHWPGVPIYDDVQTLSAARLAADGIAIDFICGGFPCQDISYAGKGAGLTGERSGLFYDVARLVSELEPSGLLLENVAALLARGLGDVLGTLASLGYDAEWHCIPASAVGAPHRRDRIWIYAYPNSNVARLEGWLRQRLQECASERAARSMGSPPAANVENADSRGRYTQSLFRARTSAGDGPDDAHCPSAAGGGQDQWAFEPALGRVAHGVPGRVDRLKQLGNAVVPQIPELIGRAILASINEQQARAA